MHEKVQNGKNFSCNEFDALLADAIDGSLAAAEAEKFRAHATGCADCGPLFAQAQEGLRWLQQLDEVEPPVNLVRNILAVTSMRDASIEAEADTRSWARRVADFISPNLVPAMGHMWSPRFAMSAAMAFFAATLLLNVTGVKLADLKNVDLRPSAITTSASMTYHQTTAKVVKYYENIRFVYEIESRWKELRAKQQGEAGGDDATEDEGEQQPPQSPKPDQQRTRERREREEQQNYSLEPGQTVLALNQKPLAITVAARSEA